jgi:hypothetical protein
LPPSCADCLDILGASTSWSPKGVSRSVQGSFYLRFQIVLLQYIQGSPERLNFLRLPLIFASPQLGICLTSFSPPRILRLRRPTVVPASQVCAFPMLLLTVASSGIRSIRTYTQVGKPMTEHTPSISQHEQFLLNTFCLDIHVKYTLETAMKA